MSNTVSALFVFYVLLVSVLLINVHSTLTLHMYLLAGVLFFGCLRLREDALIDDQSDRPSPEDLSS